MMDTFTLFTTRFLGIFMEAAPFLLLGTVTSGLIEAFLRPDDLARLVPRNALLAALAGGALGFAFPVCECGVVPVARRLVRKGLPVPVGVTFLLAAPAINPIVIASTYAAFHRRAPEIVALRVIVALGVAVATGTIFAAQRDPARLLLAPATPPGLYLEVPAPQARRKGPIAGINHALRVAAVEFFEMGRYLVIGALLAAGSRLVIDQGTLTRLATGPVSSVVVMQALAFILSICSTADAFIALDFANTFTTGSVLGFLTFGPMVDIKSTIMFLGVFRRRVVAYLILLPLLMTMLVALWINLNTRL
jgi:uncharacterized protein